MLYVGPAIFFSNKLVTVSLPIYACYNKNCNYTDQEVLAEAKYCPYCGTKRENRFVKKSVSLYEYLSDWKEFGFYPLKLYGGMMIPNSDHNNRYNHIDYSQNSPTCFIDAIKRDDLLKSFKKEFKEQIKVLDNLEATYRIDFIAIDIRN